MVDYNTKQYLTRELKGRVKKNLSGFFRVWLVGFLVLLQIAAIVYLSFLLRSLTIYFYIILEILSILIIVSLVNDNRSPSYKISWICMILVLPITGHIMYALWGKSGSKKKIEKKIRAKINHGATFLEENNEIIQVFSKKHPKNIRLSKYLISEKYPLFKNNSFKYFPMGENAFEAIFKELQQAKKFILIDFFIVAEGVLWDKMHEILLDRIKHGVEVKFLYDDFGAMLRTPKHFNKILEQEGFEVRVFNPIHKYTDKLFMNYRSHHKIIVIDGNVGFTGGINLADEYANLIDRFGVWKDNAICIKGDGVWGLTVTFLQMWEVCFEREFLDYSKYKPTMKFEANEVYAQVFADGPVNNPNIPVESICKQMINYCEEYLYITTPYLVIEDDMKNTLITAAKSGVDVRIITPHIPDKKSVKILTNYNYGLLLKGGVKIYEYTPGFIHAKTILNENAAIVGTMNMDYRSFYLHYECGILMYDQNLIDTIKKDILDTIAVCHEVTYEEWVNRPFILKVNQLILNLFSTIM